MKALLFVLGVAAAAGVSIPAAHAQNYPWCADYGGGEGGGGGSNCGFTTFQQCLDTIRGMGGFCNRNTLYVPPPGPHSAAVHQPRHRRRHPQP